MMSLEVYDPLGHACGIHKLSIYEIMHTCTLLNHHALQYNSNTDTTN